MTDEEKISFIEVTIGVDEGTLTKETELKSVDNWDSIGKLFLMSAIQKDFGRAIQPDILRGFQNVGEIMDELHE
ncbi:MAG: acyl carrier protein [Synergistaceae bacterium]|nr:acyl carrier protein [Synergistaceae bacterium]